MPIRLTKTVKALLIISLVCFLIQQTGDQFLGTRIMEWFAFVPSSFGAKFYFWQIFTYPFMHRDVMHLFFNLMMLAFIGSELEAIWGMARFLRYYFFCSTASALFYLVLQLIVMKGFTSQPMIGSSGAVYGLLMAYGLIYGERVLLFMMLFPMKAKHFIWVLALLELLTTVYSSGGPWASIAQLGGMGAGFCFLWFRATLLVARKRSGSGGKSDSILGRQKKRRSKHLKLIVNNEQDFESAEDDSENGPKTWH
jgi:membrane associated rhomboid family serine protease